jgi:hypothetical protein
VKIDLAEAEFSVLLAAELGLVRRHRARPGVSPAVGTDWRVHGRLPALDRRCATYLQRLAELDLVELPDGDRAAAFWTWRTTHLGRFVLGAVYRQWTPEP